MHAADSSDTRTPPAAPAYGCVNRAWQVHEGELRGYLRHHLADAAAADDVLQDVFLKALRAGGQFCSLDNPRAWLFQVARTTLIDRLRRQHPTDPRSEDILQSLPDEPSACSPIDALADCLTRTLAELPADDAAIVRACDIQGQTLREFAQAQGLSLPAAKSRLLRARERLRSRITQVCRVQFEPDGRVAGHAGRAGAAPDEPRHG